VVGSSMSTALRAEYGYEYDGGCGSWGHSPHRCGMRSGERVLLRPGPSTRVLVLVLLLEGMVACVVVRWRLRIGYEYRPAG